MTRPALSHKWLTAKHHKKTGRNNVGNSSLTDWFSFGADLKHLFRYVTNAKCRSRHIKSRLIPYTGVLWGYSFFASPSTESGAG